MDGVARQHIQSKKWVNKNLEKRAKQYRGVFKGKVRNPLPTMTIEE